MRFQDKVAIVTGGSSGIGKEVATRFVAEGGSVVIIGRDAAKAGAGDAKRAGIPADLCLEAPGDAKRSAPEQVAGQQTGNGRCHGADA